MNEFSRLFRIDGIGQAPNLVAIEAGEKERSALAQRFRLEAIHSLSAEAKLTRTEDVIRATGRVNAAVVQSCVATGEPVEEQVAEDFTIEFRPHVQVGSADEEIELSESELDVVFYDGGAVDLGDAVAETVSLALNPFPRSPQAEEALRAAGVKSEEEARAEASPFAGLAALKDKLGG